MFKMKHKSSESFCFGIICLISIFGQCVTIDIGKFYLKKDIAIIKQDLHCCRSIPHKRSRLYLSIHSVDN